MTQNAFVTQVPEPIEDPYGNDDLAQSASQVSANPVAGRISASQAGPQRYEPSPISTHTGKAEDAPYIERDDPEVFVNGRPEESYGSPRVDIENIEQNVENEDMLAITQHN